MKTNIFLFSVLTIYIAGHAQFGPQKIISTLDEAKSVYAADVDGDGDMDILTASEINNKIAWYKNTDEKGSFGSQQTIASRVNGAHSVYATDIDGDGDMDVLSASSSYSDSNVSWYENIDGNGNFGSQQIISTNVNWATSVYTVDIDGDGDMDVLSASQIDNKIAWYKNTDGKGNFGSQQIISTNAKSANSVFAIDIDGDGDMDVLSASASDSKIAWYENIDGKGNFGSQQIISTNVEVAWSVYASDIDGDGDMDVLSASSYDNKIAWYKNTDGKGNFGSQQIISTNAYWATAVYATDIDGDGDMDVFSTSHNDSKLAWYENTNGNGDFGSQQIISTNAKSANSVFAIDIDGDGDMDVLSGIKDKGVAWYENLGFSLSLNRYHLLEFSAYPNPTTGTITFKSKSKVAQIEIYNNLGQLLFSNENKDKIDISKLSKSLYFIKVIDINGDFGIKKVFKE